MKLFTRISFILFFIGVAYVTPQIDFYGKDGLFLSICIYIFCLIMFFLFHLFIIFFILVITTNKDLEDYFDIIKEDIKLIYKETKLMIKFYLNL